MKYVCLHSESFTSQAFPYYENAVVNCLKKQNHASFLKQQILVNYLPYFEISFKAHVIIDAYYNASHDKIEFTFIKYIVLL